MVGFMSGTKTKESPRSIQTWDDLVSKFINQFFPPSKTTNHRNEITRFQQRFDESFYEAWDRFNDLLRACPHHGFSELHQLDTFYNALNSKSKVRQRRAKAVIAKVGTSSSTPAVSFEVAELKDLVRALLLDKKNQSSAPVSSSTLAQVKAVEPNYVTCGGSKCAKPIGQFDGHASKFMSSNIASSLGSGTLPSNTIAKPKEELKGITTRSGVAYQVPTNSAHSKVVKQGIEPVAAPVSAPIPGMKSSIPYPSRHDNERRHDQANKQIEKFYEIFKDFSFEISFTDALILMPKFASTLKNMIGNKKSLEALSLSKLTPTCMTLELADRSISKPIGIAKDVSFKVDVFHFLADFVVVDFEPDPRVPLILGRCFLKTGRALIDVHKGELTLCIKNEAITYNLIQTVRYSANYNQMTANKIDVICEEYSQEVFGFSDTTASGNPTPHDNLIFSITYPTLTPFGDIDFLLFEETDALLGLEDDPDSPKINPFYYDPEGDILLLKTIFNSEPLPPLPNHEQYLPSYKKELKVCEAKTVKSSVDEPPEVELKDLPPHLEYAFLEGNNKLPVIIAKELGDEEKSALIKVLKSHKRAIAWKLSDIQGINPKFCTHKILMEEDYKPAVEHQRRVNPKIYDIIMKEVEKLLDTRLIYPISNSLWVSPTMEVFMDDFSVFGSSFENFLSRLDKMLQRIEVDRANIDVIAKLPHPTTVKDIKEKTHISSNLDCPKLDLPFELMCDASDFAIGAVLGQRHEKYFKPIHYASKTMNDAETNYTTTEKEMLAVVYAFEKFRSYLIMNKIIVHTDHSALKYLFAKRMPRQDCSGGFYYSKNLISRFLTPKEQRT
nr:reverse transcriptase domain-containing protein [Tanacetum cinerariifolium]